MRGVANPQTALFSYVSLEKRVPSDHPLHKMRILVDAVLATMDADFRGGVRQARPSVDSRRSFCCGRCSSRSSTRCARSASSSSRSASTCCFAGSRGFRTTIGCGITPPSATTESAWPTRVWRARPSSGWSWLEWQALISDEHCSVDGILIDAWAAHESFLLKERDEQDPPNQGPGRHREVDFKGKKRCNDTLASTTDPDARLYGKFQNTVAP